MGSKGRLLLAAVVVIALALGVPGVASAKGKPSGSPGKGKPKPPACTDLGVWADWMPPVAWSAAQADQAKSLICRTRAASPALDTVGEVQAAGYINLGDSAVTGFEHWVSSSRITDGSVMDPARPESVVFEVMGDGTRMLAAYMFISNSDTIPSEWAYLPGWHTHENLCFSTSTFEIVGTTDMEGNCPPGSVNVTTPPMTHVWIAHNECHDPFAGIDEGGVMCGDHEHSH